MQSGIILRLFVLFIFCTCSLQSMETAAEILAIQSTQKQDGDITIFTHTSGGLTVIKKMRKYQDFDMPWAFHRLYLCEYSGNHDGVKIEKEDAKKTFESFDAIQKSHIEATTRAYPREESTSPLLSLLQAVCFITD